MNHPLVSLLLPDYRRRILGLLLLHPEVKLHGREIARRTGLSPGTITRELVRLADAGLLLRQKQGNQQLYCANVQCPIYEELSSILKKTSGMADVLRHALAALSPPAHIAFVFGSVARGTETESSDIDLLVIGDAAFNEVVRVLWPLQQELGREINPKVFTASQFNEQQDASFLQDVLSKPKIFLIGTDHDLAELVGLKP